MILAALVLIAAPVPLSGWVVQYNPASVPTLVANGKRLNHVISEWIRCSQTGVAERRDEFPRAGYLKARDEGRKAGCKVFGMASNYLNELGGFAPGPLQAVLHDPQKRRTHVRAMVNIAVEDKLDGIDIDYESLTSQDRNVFSLFIEELSGALHAKGKLLSAALHPKESEPGNWDGPQAQDYARLGKACDVIRLMCYDAHWSGSEPGPLAPLGWTERIVKFACSAIPSKKIEIGVPGYGYIWNSNPARSVTWADWPKSARSKDPESQEYVDGKAFFAGADATKQKIDLARKYKVGGLCLWYVGSEEPALWSLFPRRR